MRYSLFAVALLFSACAGGAGGSINIASVKKFEENGVKAEARVVLNKLYSSESLKGKKAYRSAEESYQGFSGDGITVAIIDDGTRDTSKITSGFNSYYEYKTPKDFLNEDYKGNLEGINLKQDLLGRFDMNNFTRYENEGNFLEPDDDEVGPQGEYIPHGEEVMNSASKIAKNAKFANVLMQGYHDISRISATVDALSMKGVRFFNRSYGYDPKYVKQFNFYDMESYAFYPAIMYGNALVVSAAGNEFAEGTHTDNGLASDNPMRKGWIVALGYMNYEDVTEQLLEDYTLNKTGFFYYLDDAGEKVYVEHQGQVCKSLGWDDCISEDFMSPNGLLGTSFSSPTLLGKAVLVYEKFPWMSNENIKTTLFTTTREVLVDSMVVGAEDITDDDLKSRFGAGIVNGEKALNGPGKFTEKDFLADVSFDRLYEFSNDISGEKGIVKKGIGTLALSGDNTFSGASRVDEGTLWLSGGQNYAADFTNNARLRLSGITSSAAVINNATLISEGDNKISRLSLGANSKIYSNLGDLITVTGEASLDGEFNILGLNYKKVSSSGKVELLRAGSFVQDGSGNTKKFKSVQSLLAFISLNGEATYTANSVFVDARISKAVANIDELANANYQSLFKQIDNYLDYQAQQNKKNIPSDVNESSYTAAIESGSAFVDKSNFINPDDLEADVDKIERFANELISTRASELEKKNKEFFGTDYYTNTLSDIARAKRVQKTSLENGFGISEYLSTSKIDGLKAHSSTTLIGGAVSNDFARYGFAFGFDYSSIKNDDFKNKAKSYMLKAQIDSEFQSGNWQNKASFISTSANVNRFENAVKVKSKSLALSSEYSYDFGAISPYLRANAIFYKQSGFTESGDDKALKFDSFSKNFYYANLGLRFSQEYSGLRLSAYADYEYNFYKDFALNSENILTGSEFSSGNGYRVRSLANLGLNIGTNISKAECKLGIDTSFAKRYFSGALMFSARYQF